LDKNPQTGILDKKWRKNQDGLKRLLERFRALEDFEAEDQEAVIKLIDAMIVKNEVEGAITPFQKKAS
jgi:hypothetical protein